MENTTHKWYRLDNAAIIVPSTAKGSDTRVFRLVCELTQEVDPDILQKALDDTLEEFPHLNVVLKQGLFWHYLDGTALRPVVEEDHLPACAPIYQPGKRSLLYRVSYFGKRINLEVFHVLADGTGAFAVLKHLVGVYLALRHGLHYTPDKDSLSSAEEKNSDAFRQFYTKENNRSQLKQMTGVRAFQIPQDRDGYMRNHLLEGVVSAGRFLAEAKKRNTTAGVLTVALYIEAILQIMPERKRKYPIVISVPVNLRQFFASSTTRNFFGVINITYYASDYDGTLESILPHVRDSFKKQLENDSIRGTMNSYSALAQNPVLKLVPLFLKDRVIQYYSSRALKGTTGTMSNIGKITMQPDFLPYIDHFSAFMATANMQICVCTLGDRMVFGAVSAYDEHRVLANFFRNLVKRGIDVELATNDYDLR